MSLITLSPSAFSEPVPIFERQVSAADNVFTQTESFLSQRPFVVWGQFAPSSAVPAAKLTPVSDVIADWEQNPQRRAAMEEARRWAATALGDDGDTVRTLRLRKGWSQARLASEISTSQSHVARIEAGTENVSVDTCRRLAAALAVDMNALDQALRQQESRAQAKAAQ